MRQGLLHPFLGAPAPALYCTELEADATMWGEHSTPGNPQFLPWPQFPTPFLLLALLAPGVSPQAATRAGREGHTQGGESSGLSKTLVSGLGPA